MNKRFWTILSLVLALLASCKKGGEILPPPSPDGYRYVDVDLFTATNDGRLHQYVESDGRIGLPFMAEKDLAIYVVIRQNNPAPQGKQYAYQTLTFRKVLGERRATYKGQIKVPGGPSTDLDIAAILLRELPDGEVFMTEPPISKPSKVFTPGTPSLSKIDTLSNGVQKVRTLIPYVAHWRPIRLVNGGTKLEINNGTEGNTQCLVFKPSGTLLRFKIQNNLSDPIDVKSVKLYSNILVNRWMYDFSEPSFSSDLVLSGGHSDNSLPSKIDNVSYDLPSPITINGGGDESKWFYTWVMPRKAGIDAPPGGALTTFTVVSPSSQPYPAFSSTLASIIPNKAVPLTLKVNEVAPPPTPPCQNYFPFGNRLPLDYVAQSNLGGTPGAWELSGSNFNPSDESNKLYEPSQVSPFCYNPSTAAQRTIGGRKYYMPEIYDWWSIFPCTAFPPGVNFFPFPIPGPGDPRIYTVSDAMRVGGPGGRIYFEVQESDKSIIPQYKAYWMRGPNAPDGTARIYAIRLVGQENCSVLAYKYEFVGSETLSPSYSYVKIKSRYAGRSLFGQDINPSDADVRAAMNTITADDYWNDPQGVYSNDVVLPSVGAKIAIIASPGNPEVFYPVRLAGLGNATLRLEHGKVGAYRLAQALGPDGAPNDEKYYSYQAIAPLYDISTSMWVHVLVDPPLEPVMKTTLGFRWRRPRPERRQYGPARMPVRLFEDLSR